jgi:hypothetical protein
MKFISVSVLPWHFHYGTFFSDIYITTLTMNLSERHVIASVNSPVLLTILEIVCTDSQTEPKEPKYYVFGHYTSSCLYLKTVLFIFQNTTFRWLDSVSVFRLKLISWCQTIVRVPISGLALLFGINWVGFTWRRRQNPVSEMLCFEK